MHDAALERLMTLRVRPAVGQSSVRPFIPYAGTDNAPTHDAENLGPSRSSSGFAFLSVGRVEERRTGNIGL
jgi:hypothetical protein